MKEKILSRLKEKFSGVNLSKARLDAIADKLAAKITDETQIDAKLDELNEIMPFADLAKMDDRIRTFEAKEKKPEEKKPEEKKPEKAEDKPEEIPSWAKSLVESNKALAEKLSAMEKEKADALNQSSLISKLKEKGLDVDNKKILAHIKGRVFKDAEEIESFVAETAEAFEDVKPSTGGGLGAMPRPGKSVTTGKEEPDAEFSDYLKSKKPQKT